MVSVVPITEEDLPAVCHFLARGFDPEAGPEVWMTAFRHRWAAQQPNHGYMLLDEGAIVGAIGAIYSDQDIRGTQERFCNINNWYVDPAYRRHSLLLLSRLLAQKGIHFTNLRPQPEVAKICAALKFQYLDDGRVTYIVNVPGLPFGRGSKVLVDSEAVAAALPAADAKVFRDHADCPGLVQLAVGSRVDGFCHVAFHTAEVRHIPCIAVLHISDARLFSRHLPALRSHFLWRHHAPLARVETRFLPVTPRFAIVLKREPHNMFLSKTLAPGDVSNLYTEIPAMHAKGFA
jgi:hypothetical protein